jgi:hypothetical protein
MKGKRVFVVFAVAVVVMAAASAAAFSRAGGQIPFLSPSGKPLSVLPRSGISLPAPHIVSRRDFHHDTSKPLRSIRPLPVPRNAERGHEQNVNPRVAPTLKNAPDGALQTKAFSPNMPSTAQNFDGMSNACSCYPPDTNGEAGATQYLQMDNLQLQVFNKSTGASVLAAESITTLWSGFGGVCETSGYGDPVVVYDQFANRWVVSQFAGTNDTATDECVAVSTTSDATGSWHRYGFHLGSDFYDYPKLGVWNDGYYMSMNVFGNTFLGPQPFVFDRTKMLAGQSATYVTTGLLPSSSNQIMPADADGSTPPPAGAPNPFLASGTASSTWTLFRFHADFTTPANSTFTSAGSLSAAAFTALCPATSSCVPQAGTSVKLDGLADREMFRSAYRNFGDHEALVGNMSVNAGAGVAGVRWWEINHVTSGTPAFAQQATYSPDATHRWMGSVAMDASGDMALGYSASSATINPQIRYTGRLSGDAANTMGQGEGTIFAGTGSQTGSGNRWGDYSDMSIDPSDDCTFWYTTEYYATTVSGSVPWKTRIASFAFPGCSSQHGTLNGTVTDSATNTGISGATVLVQGQSLSTQTDGAGAYSLVLPPGTYSLTISKAGYATKNVSNVVVQNGQTVVSDTTLDPAPALQANGSNLVSESLTPPNGVIDPGETVSVDLAVKNTGLAGTSNLVGTLQATGGVTNPSAAQSYGAVAANSGTGTKTFSFTADRNLTCGNQLTATLHLQDGSLDLGNVTYIFQLGTRQIALGENFDGVTAPALPAAWSASTASGNAWVTSATGSDTPPNDAFADDPGSVSDKSLVTATVAQSSASAQLTFRQSYDMEGGYDGGVLEISVDGGNFQDIVTAGGSFVTGGYTGTIDTRYSSPIAGRSAWTGSTNGFITTTVNLPATAAGHNIQLRFRQGSDTSVGKTGWRIDTLKVEDGWSCSPPPQQHTLTVTKTGTGTGAVSSTPIGIACGATCSGLFDEGGTVALHAAPATGSWFAGWGGACTGTGACNVSMSANTGVTATFTHYAADGSGAMKASISTVSAGQVHRTVTLSYTAATGGIANGKLTFSVPTGWSAPSTTGSASGYTTTSNGTLSVSGQTVTVSGITRAVGQVVAVKYGSVALGGPGATAPSTPGAQTWLTKERSTAAGSLTSLASSPVVTVYAKDGSGTMKTVTTSVVHSATGRTITFDYVAATGGIAAGTVTLTVPSGWSAPSKTGTDRGYVTASKGAVSVSGQTITVSNVTRAAGQDFTLTYGSRALGGPGATATATIGSQTWWTKERSTAGGYMKLIASSPIIRVT